MITELTYLINQHGWRWDTTRHRLRCECGTDAPTQHEHAQHIAELIADQYELRGR